jgi:uncharacterized protein (UPF0548 family)
LSFWHLKVSTARDSRFASAIHSFHTYCHIISSSEDKGADHKACQVDNMHIILWNVVFLLSLFTSVLAGPSWPSKSNSRLSHAFGKSTRRTQSTLRSWMIRHDSNARQRRYTRTPTTPSKSAKKNATKGSMFSFQTPTLERVSNWFSNPWQADPQHLRAMLKYELSHDSVGMTNPCLHIDLRRDHDNHNNGNGGLETTTIPASIRKTSSTAGTTTTNSWWPNVLLSDKKKNEWRVLTYRRRVGTGDDCYQRVKNAALDWEFGDEDLGMINVPATAATSATSHTPGQQQRYSAHSLLAESSHQQLWSGPGGRRFVTYSGSGSSSASSSTTKFKFRVPIPRIYAINQVCVIYDLVDQRAPSTTYTSTAYATMKGHLLSGEERVTVALRDGTQAVEVEIVSVSKPGPSLPSKLLWPFIGKMQQTFFERQMESLEQAANKVTVTSTPFGIPSSSSINNNIIHSNIIHSNIIHDQNTRTIHPVVAIDASSSNNLNTEAWSRSVSMANLVLD